MTTLTEIAARLRELATTLDTAFETEKLHAIGAAGIELAHIAATLDQHAAEAVKVPEGAREQDDVKRLRALAKDMAAEGETYHIPGAKEDAAAIVSVLARLEAAEADAERLLGLVNSPHTANFLDATRIEVAHQIERWATTHDRAKQPEDWFWLVGYLAGKALAAHRSGDHNKALHHTISTAAVLANWWAAIQLIDNRMQPGSASLQDFLRENFPNG